ncbi:sigma factor-like helix-turn-helix DNA-binding protein [Streptomyces pseudovenezuelae]|uniref:DNA-directed RNA polymerase specialized sigma24 family protein n=1 Tax=Streptomyces pseudovenezuelae TaxID=67350 RepID=A0ABT6LEV8_9ACTN|nr:sigma factor-like helix-turn-helix DNA-binding protein [Streptomyces pseudovenezuelae]MDH6214839.1 DNA-directed RNA polymerase specialized sigma24 family protein [Streptomyces pseudovenezuelae]
MPHPHDDFAAYAHAGLPQLVTTARLLTGDPREATELVRRTLVRVCARWRRIPRDDVDFYVRRTLVKEYLRRARHQRALPHGVLGAPSARQWAVLVMLHREGLREAEIAQLLGWSGGAVRSRAQRGLAVCGGDVERLRGLFAEAAGGAGAVEPAARAVQFDVPLDAVEQRGRALRRRRRGVGVTVCALLLVPTGVFVAGRFMGGDSTDGSGGGAADVAQSPVRIVAPGERVDALPEVQVWLTSGGKHWSTPDRPNQFLGLTDDDGYESEKSAVSVQPEPLHSSYFLSGLYRGLSADPARVEVGVAEGKITGTVLTLAGSPGWGVWYARAPMSMAKMKSTFVEGGPTVTVYDAAGKVVARGGGDR